MKIDSVQLDLRREALVRPFGFKGGYFTEKWVMKAVLQDADGHIGQGEGGLAVLWSDAEVFSAHTETGGNLLMAAMLEAALQQSRGFSFDSPLELLDRLLEPTWRYGQRITGRPALRKTFALNSLVALDNAAWMLTAAVEGITSFDRFIPESVHRAMPQRHSALARVPLISYGVGIDEIQSLVQAGHFILKIKIGAPGDVKEMVKRDAERLREIHQAIGQSSTPHTEDGRIRYYLDANGRYPGRAALEPLLDEVDRIGMRRQVLILEEPFPEEVEASVRDLGVIVAADESLHDPQDVARRAQLGYGAVALKPAGKTLSMTFRMAQAAVEAGMDCFVADSACPPGLVDWNRNVAARLAPLPGLKVGLMESNGAQNYARWDQMLAAHPWAGADWLKAREGLFHLDQSFYEQGGGLWPPKTS